MVRLDRPQRARSPTRRSARCSRSPIPIAARTRSEASVSRPKRIEAGNPLLEGSDFGLDIRLPKYAAYLALSYFLRDGTVHHVLPGRNWAWPANAREFIGVPALGKDGSANVEMVVAVASDVPLFASPRPSRGGCRKLPRRPAQASCRDERCRRSRRGRRHPARDHARAAAAHPDAAPGWPSAAQYMSISSPAPGAISGLPSIRQRNASSACCPAGNASRYP